MVQIARQWIVIGCLMCLGGCRVMPSHVASISQCKSETEPAGITSSCSPVNAIVDSPTEPEVNVEQRVDGPPIADEPAVAGGNVYLASLHQQVAPVQQVLEDEQIILDQIDSNSPCCLLDAVPSAGEFLSLAADDPDYGPAQALTARECQCAAVQNCRVANLIEKERHLLCCLARDFGVEDYEMAKLGSGLLAFRAIRERNRAAQMALEAFHNLIEVHCQRQILLESQQVLLGAENALKAVRDSGLGGDVDSSAIAKRRFELERKAATLDFNQEQLNRQLKLILAVNANCHPEDIQPICDSNLPMSLTDLATATATAKVNRAEVRAHELLLGSMSESDMPIARFSLRGADPTLGANLLADASSPGIFGDLIRRKSGSPEYAYRYDQLQQLNLTTQEAVETEVAIAYHEVRNLLKQLAIAKNALTHAKDELTKIESSRSGGNVETTFEDVVNARMSVLQAKSSLIHDIILYQQAQVRYRGAQGLLTIECEDSLSGCQSCSKCLCRTCSN